MSLSLYAKYVLERESFSTVEDHYGFATFKINGDECYVRDVFVDQKVRRLGYATKYMDVIKQIAKEASCKTLVTIVCPRAKGSTESITACLNYGFKLHHSDQNLITLYMEI